MTAAVYAYGIITKYAQTAACALGVGVCTSRAKLKPAGPSCDFFRIRGREAHVFRSAKLQKKPKLNLAKLSRSDH